MERIRKLLEDKNMRSKLIKAILGDRELISDIAKEVFATPAKSVGLNGPGSIADFFRGDWEKET